MKVTTFRDIINILKKKPEWREEMRQLILTEELMKLPQKVDKLSERFDNFVREDFRPLKDKVEVIEKDVSVLKEDVGVLKKDVGVLKEDVAVLKEDVSVLKQDMVSLKQEVRSMKDDIAYLRGAELERRVRERAPAYFGKLVRKCRSVSLEDLAERLDDACDAGIISDEERADAILIDAVVRGRLRTGKEVILAVEVSETVDRDRYDVERASRRAEVIARAFNAETIGVCFGKEKTEGAETRAEDLGVFLFP